MKKYCLCMNKLKRLGSLFFLLSLCKNTNMERTLKKVGSVILYLCLIFVYFHVGHILGQSGWGQLCFHLALALLFVVPVHLVYSKELMRSQEQMSLWASKTVILIGLFVVYLLISFCFSNVFLAMLFGLLFVQEVFNCSSKGIDKVGFLIYRIIVSILFAYLMIHFIKYTNDVSLTALFIGNYALWLQLIPFVFSITIDEVSLSLIIEKVKQKGRQLVIPGLMMLCWEMPIFVTGLFGSVNEVGYVGFTIGLFSIFVAGIWSCSYKVIEIGGCFLMGASSMLITLGNCNVFIDLFPSLSLGWILLTLVMGSKSILEKRGISTQRILMLSLFAYGILSIPLTWLWKGTGMLIALGIVSFGFLLLAFWKAKREIFKGLLNAFSPFMAGLILLLLTFVLPSSWIFLVLEVILFFVLMWGIHVGLSKWLKKN